MQIAVYRQHGRKKKVFKHWKNPGYKTDIVSHYFWLFKRYLIRISF